MRLDAPKTSVVCAWHLVGWADAAAVSESVWDSSREHAIHQALEINIQQGTAVTEMKILE